MSCYRVRRISLGPSSLACDLHAAMKSCIINDRRSIRSRRRRGRRRRRRRRRRRGTIFVCYWWPRCRMRNRHTSSSYRVSQPLLPSFFPPSSNVPIIIPPASSFPVQFSISSQNWTKTKKNNRNESGLSSRGSLPSFAVPSCFVSFFVCVCVCVALIEFGNLFGSYGRVVIGIAKSAWLKLEMSFFRCFSFDGEGSKSFTWFLLELFKGDEGFGCQSSSTSSSSTWWFRIEARCAVFFFLISFSLKGQTCFASIL